VLGLHLPYRHHVLLDAYSWDGGQLGGDGMGKAISNKSSVVGYSTRGIVENWLFTIVIAVLIFSMLFLLRDWLYATFGVYGKVYIPTPFGHDVMVYIHIAAGFAFIVLGLEHLIRYLRAKEKPLYPYKTGKDFGDFLHSGLYLLFMAQREVNGRQGKYNGRQRITYLAFVYIAGLACVTGLLYLFGVLPHSLGFVHVLPGGLAFMVVLFQFLMILKNHDVVSAKAMFVSGKFPVWYIRKNKPLWYEELKAGK